ncbi:RNA polymerase sigma factor RpoE [Methylophaga frappieri]|uniref:RNA polymerase sigma factor RpoE n=1 Tax=Methylophaga frappieri (strain ATCC BAA-2434 / DSM 25690 / JAM7) TaxID=754477 RepID=I1YEG2_METFJ|nr:sigma-70 family RNA polymerase sigma factor [Methylophaga frappieri]AFJ01305.1 RNA polymerase sigma factor RpoE [Methylophaga frappieri]
MHSADSQPYDNEAELIKALLSNEATAFEYLVARYHMQMRTVASAIIGEAFADDVVQDAWISAITNLPTFAGRSRLSTWLMQIVANGAKTRLRKEKRQVSLDKDWQAIDEEFDHRQHWRQDVLPWDIDTPEALATNQQLVAIIEKAFIALPAMQRAVIEMHDLHQMPMPEICNILDVSASNARVLLHRARHFVRQKITQFQEQA